jgi:hypothetical protein
MADWTIAHLTFAPETKAIVEEENIVADTAEGTHIETLALSE